MVSPKTLSKDSLKSTNLPQNAQAFLLELQAEFPDFSWRLGSRFKFKPEKTIFIDQNSPAPWPYFALLTLHELGHGLCGHKDYKTDVMRIRIESEAWQRAKRLIGTHKNWQKTYQIFYDEDFAESELDSYRDWLHARSKCKRCGLTCFQTRDGKYHCPNCDLL
jgi:hypothetical protein